MATLRSPPPSSQFSGITLSELDFIEEKVNVNIDVFEFDKAETPPVLFILRCCSYKHTAVLKLLHYEKSFHVYPSLACRQRNALWKTLDQLNRHEKKCTGTHFQH